MDDAQTSPKALQTQPNSNPRASAKPKPPERISVHEVKDALLRSGYLLEHRLETALSKRGYYVGANEAYPDPETGKAREFDLYAMAAHHAGPEDYDFIFTVLLVECINNPQPIVFLTKKPQAAFLHSQEVKMAGLPVKIPDKERRNQWDSLADFLEMSEYHHYCKGRVATQFCSFVRKKNSQDWMATHDEDHFDALRKLSAVTEWAINNNFTHWTLDAKERINIEFYYPVLVFQGDLLEARADGKSLTLLPTEHVQFRRATISGRGEQTFQIDVVTEKRFPTFVKLLEAEMEKTARLLRRRHLRVEDAIRRIVRGARRLRSPDKIRKALEF